MGKVKVTDMLAERQALPTFPWLKFARCKQRKGFLMLSCLVIQAGALG
jgi:hypothetical protein